MKGVKKALKVKKRQAKKAKTRNDPWFSLLAFPLAAFTCSYRANSGCSAFFNFLDFSVHHIVVSRLGFGMGSAWSTGCAACSGRF